MSTPQPNPIDIARDWLRQQREDVNGPMYDWKDEVMDRYHRDLGMLVDFVTDCWPDKNDCDRP